MNFGPKLEFLVGEISRRPYAPCRDTVERDIKLHGFSEFLLGSLTNSDLLGSEVLDPTEELEGIWTKGRGSAAFSRVLAVGNSAIADLEFSIGLKIDRFVEKYGEGFRVGRSMAQVPLEMGKLLI